MYFVLNFSVEDIFLNISCFYQMYSFILFVLYSMKTAFTNQNLIQAEEKLLYEVQGVVFAQRGEAELGKDNPEDLVL